MCQSALLGAFVAPEEQCDGAGTGVTADGGADVIYLDLAVELGELLFYEIGDGARVVIAGGVGDVALAGVVVAVLRMLFHAAHDLFYNALLGADLGAGDEAAEVIHIQQRADLKQAAEHGRGL